MLPLQRPSIVMKAKKSGESHSLNLQILHTRKHEPQFNHTATDNVCLGETPQHTDITHQLCGYPQVLPEQFCAAFGRVAMFLLCGLPPPPPPPPPPPLPLPDVPEEQPAANFLPPTRRSFLGTSFEKSVLQRVVKGKFMVVRDRQVEKVTKEFYNVLT